MRDLRVLELAADVGVAWCGRLLASTGADVVLAEPPGGGPLRHASPWFTDRAGVRRSATHEHLHGAKRGVRLVPDDPEFDAAVRWADVVLMGCDGDVPATAALHRRIAGVNRRAVVTVVSGFGLSGPSAGWRHSTLIDWASGGYLYLTGEAEREPLQGGGPWASYVTGTTAAVATAAAVMEATRTGSGQLVDVGAMEAVAAAQQWSIVMYTHTGAVKRRWGRRFGEAHYPLSLYRCMDGRWLCVVAATPEQWEHFCATTGTTGLLADHDLDIPGVRFARADEIDAAVAPFLATHTAGEAVERLQANRVPAGPMLDFVEVLASAHERSRGFWQPREDLASGATLPGPPFRLDDHAARPAPAPALGADDAGFRGELLAPVARRQPRIDLRAVRVVELTVAWAGPLAGRWLADLGADVVKVEHPTARGVRRRIEPPGPGEWRWGEDAPPRVRAPIYPQADPGERPWNRGGSFNKLNRGRRGVCLDAKAPGGREVLDELIAGADLLVHNFTPRGARTLGVDPERLTTLNSTLASVAMTGWGEHGPMATYSSYGPILEAYAGFDEATGYRGGGPMRIGLALADAVGGLHGAYALLAALWEREVVQRPVHVDLAQLEAMLAIGGERILVASIDRAPPARNGNRSADHAPQGVYSCAGDDAWVAVTVADDTAWRALVDLVDDERLDALSGASLAQRTEHHDEIDVVLAAWTGRRAAAEAAADLQRAGVAACPAMTNRDLVEDPHLAARGFIAEWDQPDVGIMRFPGFPVHFERLSVSLRHAPSLGEHNEEVLRALGRNDAELAALTAAGAIADAPPDAPSL